MRGKNLAVSNQHSPDLFITVLAHDTPYSSTTTVRFLWFSLAFVFSPTRSRSRHHGNVVTNNDT